MKPVAQKVAKELQKHRQRKVVDLAAVREAKQQMGDVNSDLDGFDPSGTIILAHYRALQLMAQMVLGARALDKLALRIDEAQEAFMPGGPPMSPITDSLFMTWSLCDLRVGSADETLASIVADIVPALGLPRGLQADARASAESRLGIYKVTRRTGLDATLFDVVEQKSVDVHLVDAWGSTGQLWLVRVNQNPADLGPGFHVLTTPYLLTASEQDWAEYLRRVSPEGKVEALRDHFKRPRKVDFWLDYVMDGYVGENDGLICLAGVPDRPQSLPHSDEFDAPEVTPLDRFRNMLWGTARESGLAKESDALFDEICKDVGGLAGVSPNAQHLAAAYQIYGHLSPDSMLPLIQEYVGATAIDALPRELQREVRAMKDGWFSIFEIRLVRVDEGLELFDTLRRKIIFVRERSATHHVSSGDALLAQLLSYEDGSFTLEGAVAHVPRMWAAAYVEEARRLRDRLASRLQGLDWRTRAGLLVPHAVALRERMAKDPPLPRLVNFDGNDLVWSEAHYDITDLERTLQWLDRAAEASGPGQWTIAGEKALEASLEVKEMRLAVQCNSRERLSALRTRLEKDLGQAVRWKVDTFRDSEVMLREARNEGQSRKRNEPSELPPEMMGAVADHIEGMMRAWLETKIPMLGNRSPRQAIRSARGRAQVTELLLGQERALKSNPQMAFVDLRFMWDELGLSRPQ